MVCCECVVSVCVFSLTLISLSSMEDPWPRTSRRPVGNDSMEACTTRRLTPARARESVHNPGPQGSPLPQGSTLGSQDPQVQQCTDTPSAAMQRVPQAPAARLGAGCRETGRDGVDSRHYISDLISDPLLFYLSILTAVVLLVVQLYLVLPESTTERVLSYFLLLQYYYTNACIRLQHVHYM